jgi:hypothetical protein
MPNKSRIKTSEIPDVKPETPTLRPTFIILIIAIAVVVALIGAVVFLYLASGQEEDTSDDLSIPPPRGAVVADPVPAVTEAETEAVVTEAVVTEAEETVREEVVTEAWVQRFTGEYNAEFFVDTLFIGDSVFTGIDLYGFLPARNVFARIGISASAMMNAEINGRTLFGEYGIAPQFNRAVIMIGTNGLNGMNSPQVAADVLRLADTLRLAQPEIQVIVLTVTPVWQINEYGLTMDTINGFNAILTASAAEYQVIVLDFCSALKDSDGFLSVQYAQPDGVHLRQAAYGVMLNMIQSSLSG